MTTKINGRTPEEIKKGLEYYAETDLAKKLNACKQGLKYWYAEDVAADALAYIRQLERERDALLKDFKNYQNRQFDAHKGPYACDLCKWGNFYGHGGNCKCPDSATCIRMDKWEWRGVQEVE